MEIIVVSIGDYLKDNMFIYVYICLVFIYFYIFVYTLKIAVLAFLAKNAGHMSTDTKTSPK